jgi:hypothetical protein
MLLMLKSGACIDPFHIIAVDIAPHSNTSQFWAVDVVLTTGNTISAGHGLKDTEAAKYVGELRIAHEKAKEAEARDFGARAAITSNSARGQ